MFVLLTALALAQEPEPERSGAPHYGLNVGGTVIAGNLTQAQLTVQGHLSHDGEKTGNDLIVSGYRLWTRLPGTTGLTRIGDDAAITTVPFHYVHPKVPIIGLAQFAWSQLHQIDSRFLVGGAVGYTPVRTKPVLLRLGVGPFFERTAYPSPTLNRDVSQQGSVRTVARIGTLASGWYRPEDSPLSLRLRGWFYVNPAEPEDYRGTLDTTVGLHVAGPLSLQAGLVAAASSVVVEGVETYDLRSNVGIQVSSRNK